VAHEVPLLPVQSEVVAMKWLFLIVLLSAVLTTSTPCAAKVVPFTLDQMVDRSWLIVVGKTAGVTEIPQTVLPPDAVCPTTLVTIAIEQVILGAYDKKEVVVVNCAGLSPQPEFVIGQRCVFFIGLVGDRNFVVQAYAGEVPITDDHVEVGFIRGEQKHQTLSDFILRIKQREYLLDKQKLTPIGER
jgi:hypothetical protein